MGKNKKTKKNKELSGKSALVDDNPMYGSNPDSTLIDMVLESRSGNASPAVSEELLFGTKVEDKKKQAVSEADRAARRAAYNMAINKIKETLSVEGIECNSYTAVRGDTVSKIAIKTLKDEGISKPSASQINQRIALIALLNEMEDVNKLYVNQMVKIPSAELNAYIESNEELKQLLEMFMA